MIEWQNYRLHPDNFYPVHQFPTATIIGYGNDYYLSHSSYSSMIRTTNLVVGRARDTGF